MNRWSPYLRSVLRDADAAREMSHAFFAEMLAGGKIGGAEPGRGRFRFTCSER